MAVLSATFLFTACTSENKKEIVAEDAYEIAKTPAPPSQDELIARGKYLVNAVGCDDCHSPKVMTDHGPEPDPNRRLSGHNMK
jgi:CxxC motif-containing protein (DUF1111 family)